MDTDVAIIGGGIVGVMLAAELASTYDVVLFEKETRLGEGTSTRNSGVIHAGFYYPTGSLKAELCVRGASLLYEMCEELGVPFKMSGKIVVAPDFNSVLTLEMMLKRGEQNGVEGLRFIGSAEMKSIEPNVTGAIALYSPNTGILDPSELIQRVAAKASSDGAMLLPGYAIEGIEMIPGGFCVYAHELGDMTARHVINAAGLFSDEVARMVGIDDYTIHPCKGSYMRLVSSKKDIVNGLVYPVPIIGSPGLGVHFTKEISGDVVVGPNAEYVTGKDYNLDVDEFLESARKMIPSLTAEDLRPDYCGLRAKTIGPNEKREQDFVIDSVSTPGMIHLIGIESPGLTASPAIAKYVKGLLDGMK